MSARWVMANVHEMACWVGDFGQTAVGYPDVAVLLCRGVPNWSIAETLRAKSASTSVAVSIRVGCIINILEGHVRD